MVSNSEAVWANSLVELGELLLLDRAQRDRDLHVLPGEVPAEQLRGEGGALACAQTTQDLVNALEHVAEPTL
jgi:hypothetical protein